MAARYRFAQARIMAGDGKTAGAASGVIPVISVGARMLKKPNVAIAAVVVVVLRPAVAIPHQAAVHQARAVHLPVLPAAAEDKAKIVVATGTAPSIPCAPIPITAGDGKTRRAVLDRIPVTASLAMAEWFASNQFYLIKSTNKGFSLLRSP